MEPEVLVFDEPTSGLDPNQIAEIRDVIKALGKEKTLILSTHVLSEVEATCDRVIIMYDGRIVAEQDGPSATEASMLAAAHGLPTEDQAAS